MGDNCKAAEAGPVDAALDRAVSEIYAATVLGLMRQGCPVSYIACRAATEGFRAGWNAAMKQQSEARE